MELVRLKLNKAYCGLSSKSQFKDKITSFIANLDSKFIIARVYLNHVEKASLNEVKQQLLDMSVADVIKSELTLQVKRK